MKCIRQVLWFMPFVMIQAAIPSVPHDPVDGSVSSAQGMERLVRGEVLVENVRTDEAGGSVRVQALLHSDLGEIWAYVASCESVFEYVEGLRDCELLKVVEGYGSDTTILRQVVKKSWIIPKIEYTMEVRRQPPGRIDFKLIEGDLKVMEGGWRFNSLPGQEGTVVTHEIRVQPAFPVPRWLIRRSMGKDIPDMLACLRGLTDGSGNHSRDDDLWRCPKQRKRDRGTVQGRR
jgi:ribosome-associated toxin RatA of RatAB toxin-antitoxin module